MKTEFVQKLLLMLLTWLVQYLEGWHLHRNGGKKKVDETVTTEGKETKC